MYVSLILASCSPSTSPLTPFWLAQEHAAHAAQQALDVGVIVVIEFDLGEAHTTLDAD
jgi:hypothetical protein